MTQASPSSGQSLIVRVLHNSGAYIAGDIFYRFVNFFSGIAVARSLGSEIYGYYSFIYVFLSFFETFVSFGLNNILMREIAQHPKESAEWLGSALVLRTILILISIPVSWILIATLGYPVPVRAGVMLASFQLFLLLRANFEVVFQVKLLMSYPALWNGLRAVLNLVLVLGVAWWKPSLPNFIFAALGSGVIGLIGIGWNSRRFTGYKLGWDIPRLKYFLHECMPLLAAGVLTLICLRADVFLLSKMRGFQEVGYYQAVVRLGESLGLIAVSILTSVYPLLAENFTRNPAQFEKLFSHTYKIFFLISLPIALGGFFTARDLMVTFFGQDYAPSGRTLMIYLWYMPAYFIGCLFVNVLYACRRQIVDVWITFAQIFVNLGLNFYLIGRYGYNGCAAAAVISAFFAVLMMAVYLERKAYVSLSRLAGETGRLLGINFIFFILLFFLKKVLGLHLWALIISGIAAYAALVFGFRIVSWRLLNPKMMVTKEDALESP